MAGLNLTLSPLTLPAGTEFPGTPQALLTQIAQYMAILGGADFSGINYGDTTPSADDRDKPWFKTDGSGNPIGWYGWDGAAWVAIPVVAPSGATADRPAGTDGSLYLDTDINCLLIYERSQWRTVSGSPGDVKFVTGTTLATVLTQNPGWSHYTAGIGSVFAGALANGSDAETDVGSNTHTNTVAEMAAHTHEDVVVTGSNADNGDSGPLCITAATESNGTHTVTGSSVGTKGDGEAWDLRQATRILFCLTKD